MSANLIIGSRCTEISDRNRLKYLHSHCDECLSTDRHTGCVCLHKLNKSSQIKQCQSKNTLPNYHHHHYQQSQMSIFNMSSPPTIPDSTPTLPSLPPLDDWFSLTKQYLCLQLNPQLPLCHYSQCHQSNSVVCGFLDRMFGHTENVSLSPLSPLTVQIANSSERSVKHWTERRHCTVHSIPHKSIQLMLISFAVSLVVSSCQPSFPIIGPPTNRTHWPNKSENVATIDNITGYSYYGASSDDDRNVGGHLSKDDPNYRSRQHHHHQQQQLYRVARLPTRQNQSTDQTFSGKREHSNRYRKRPKRLSKISLKKKLSKPIILDNKSSLTMSGQDTPLPTLANVATPTTVLLPNPSISLLSSSSLQSSSSKLLSSIQVSQMKPPYAANGESPLSTAELDQQQSSASRNDLERASARNITAQVGHPAYMHCLVNTIGDKMVSWIRLRDFHLLTIGSLTYIQDDRFAIRYGTHQPNDWALQIKHVTVKDEGLYECQINSDPPRSQYYYLHVVVPVSEIVGNPDIFVRSGAPINLTCFISSSPEPPAFVFWYHNNRMINYDYDTVSQGQISVQKDPTKNDVIISRLLIKQAKLHDSGNYTCSPSNADSASTYVHVLQGEKRLSNQVQNDWGQTEQTATNEGHHSGQSSSLNLSLGTAVFILINSVCSFIYAKQFSSQ